MRHDDVRVNEDEDVQGMDAEPIVRSLAGPRRRVAVRHAAVGFAVLLFGAGLGLLAARHGASDTPLEPAAAAGAVAPRGALLDVSSEPSGAELFVDGVYVGRTPARALHVDVRATRTVKVEVRRNGYETVRRSVIFEPDVERGHVALELERLSPTR